MLDTYETAFGIRNHSDPNNGPLALVAYNWAEDNGGTSELYERIKQFEERRVGDRFKISLVEFFELPREICTYMLELSFKRTVQEGQIAQNATTILDNIGKH